jgi:hypothetical protein
MSRRPAEGTDKVANVAGLEVRTGWFSYLQEPSCTMKKACSWQIWLLPEIGLSLLVGGEAAWGTRVSLLRLEDRQPLPTKASPVKSAG